jgi:hypothetical protein
MLETSHLLFTMSYEQLILSLEMSTFITFVALVEWSSGRPPAYQA